MVARFFREALQAQSVSTEASTLAYFSRTLGMYWGNMKTIAKLAIILSLLLCAALVPSVVHAQGPIISGVGPTIRTNVGFSYTQQQVPSAATVPLYGLDAGATVDASRRFGLTLDFGYSRASNVFSSGYHSDMMTYLAGPVFYPVTARRMQIYVHLLAGAARVTGATPTGNGQYVRGYANEFAWAGGGGLEIHSSFSTAVRFGGDYLHTSYFDPSVTLQGQGNLRAVVSFVYFLGRNPRRSF